jgi:hypothetical protein
MGIITICKDKIPSQEWWYISVILALRSLRQEDHEFRAAWIM